MHVQTVKHPRERKGIKEMWSMLSEMGRRERERRERERGKKLSLVFSLGFFAFICWVKLAFVFEYFI
jgi:hypothetical protein